MNAQSNQTMSSYFSCLPVEIQELILSFLPMGSLLHAARVCRLWFEISDRITKKLFQRKADLVDEIEREKYDADSMWLEVANRSHMSNLLGQRILDCKTIMLNTNSLTRTVKYVIQGSYLYAFSPPEMSIYVVSPENLILRWSGNALNGEVRSVRVVPNLKICLVLTNNIEAFTLPYSENGRVEVKKLKVEVIESPDILWEKSKISVDFKTLAVKDEALRVIVLDMEKKEDCLLLKGVKTLEFSNTIRQFSLRNKKVTALLETGHIIQWVVTSADYVKFGPYQEIRYGNPAWMFRDTIFCSTSISSRLLGYWHFEAGTTYWLMGKPPNLLKVFSFQALFDDRIEEITSLDMKHTLLVCGTASGFVLIYKLSDLFLDGRFGEEFSRSPDLVLRVFTERVDDAFVEFGDDLISILVRSGTTNSIHLFYVPKSLTFDGDEASPK